jgi:Uncharacterised protein family UPF0547
MTSPPEYKRCPDCAEQVLAAARKCRYCGYRFEATSQNGSALAELFGFRRTMPGGTLSDVLTAWGLGLREAEQVAFFSLATVDDRCGYMLVTTERLVFFAQIARGKHVRAFEHPLSALSQVSVQGGRLRRRLELRGSDFRHLVRCSEIEQLGEHLTGRYDSPGRGNGKWKR